MNFQNFLEELDQLYEADTTKAAEDKEKETTLVEDVDDEEEEFEIVDDAAERAEEDEVADEEVAKRLVLECANCGGIVIKEAADVVVDEKTDLANMSDACQYCEETAGYTIVGEVVPYTPVETDPVELDEGFLTEGKIVDAIKKVATRVGADASTIVRVFAELSGSDKLYDVAEYVENKAVLKALLSGNEKVFNGLTKEDIEELEDDISDYESEKAAAKDGKTLDDVGGKAKDQRQLYDVLSENEDGEPEAIAVGLYKNAAEKRAAEKEKQLGRKCWVEPSGNA